MAARDPKLSCWGPNCSGKNSFRESTMKTVIKVDHPWSYCVDCYRSVNVIGECCLCSVSCRNGSKHIFFTDGMLYCIKCVEARHDMNFEFYHSTYDRFRIAWDLYEKDEAANDHIEIIGLYIQAAVKRIKRRREIEGDFLKKRILNFILNRLEIRFDDAYDIISSLSPKQKDELRDMHIITPRSFIRCIQTIQ